MRFRDIKKQSHNNTQTKKQDSAVIYASYIDKIKALITDIFMIYGPILYVMAYGVMNGKDDFQSSQLAPLIGVTLYGLVYAMFLSKFGQTPGKKAYNIKVVDFKTHKNISFFRALFRFVAFLFSATIVIGLLVPLFRKDKRSLHDLLASTAVISIKS